MLPRRPHAGNRCAVYRWYSSDDQLLYIGSSLQPARRWANLRRTQGWMRKFAHRHTCEWYDDGRDANRVELAAIKNEGPIFNIEGHVDYRNMTRDQYSQLYYTPRGGEPILCVTYIVGWLCGQDEIDAYRIAHNWDPITRTQIGPYVTGRSETYPFGPLPEWRMRERAEAAAQAKERLARYRELLH